MLTELQIKILKIAAEIAGMNGNRAGDRACQDWAGDQSVLDALTQEEKNLLMEKYEKYNSNGVDFESDSFANDEMLISFCIQQNLLEMVKELID